MKILFVSMPSVHAIRWIENLKDTSYELYYFDVLGKGKLETLASVSQFTDWKKRKMPYIKGEYFLSKKHPSLFEKVMPFLEVTANEALGKIINEIKPDIIHSFEMQSCSYPILKTMKKYPSIKWLYSCWGNDLFFYQNLKVHNTKIRKVLARIDFMHTDCYRDFLNAQKMNFKGIHVGIIPGGAGYQLEKLSIYKRPIEERKIILIKGYQHKFGRGLMVIIALKEMLFELQDYSIVVFGAHFEVVEFIKENGLPFVVYDRHGLQHDELLTLMGSAVLYIGNSVSDGIPNTLLEAIVMGAFPIQSNPGGASAEVITHGVNGLLIEDPESIDEIQELVRLVIMNPIMIEKAMKINDAMAHERLGYEFNKRKIVDLYKNIHKTIKSLVLI